MKKNRKFTSEQDALIYEYFSKISISELASKIGKTKKQVANRAYALGLRTTVSVFKHSSYKGWDKAEERRLSMASEHFDSLKDVCKEFPNRTPASVRGKMHQLGLTLSGRPSVNRTSISRIPPKDTSTYIHPALIDLF